MLLKSLAARALCATPSPLSSFLLLYILMHTLTLHAHHKPCFTSYDWITRRH